MVKTKHNYTYLEAHNKAVKTYQRTAIFLLWSGVVNVFASIIGVIQISAGATMSKLTFLWPNSGFAMCYSGQMVLNSLLIQNLDQLVADILILLISLILGACFAFIGIFAAKGKKVFLLLGGIIYAIDFASMFFVYKSNLVPMVWTNYAFTLVTHIIILVATCVALVEYYNVIHIEKVFKGEKALKFEEEVESEEIAHGK